MRLEASEMLLKMLTNGACRRPGNGIMLRPMFNEFGVYCCDLGTDALMHADFR